MKEITKEELEGSYGHCLTVGKLKKFLKETDLPDNAKVLIERVEDCYYENNNWGVYLKKGFNSFKDKKGDYIKESLNQYHPAWSTVHHKDEKHLFIDLHY